MYQASYKEVLWPYIKYKARISSIIVCPDVGHRARTGQYVEETLSVAEPGLTEKIRM